MASGRAARAKPGPRISRAAGSAWRLAGPGVAGSTVERAASWGTASPAAARCAVPRRTASLLDRRLTTRIADRHWIGPDCAPRLASE